MLDLRRVLLFAFLQLSTFLLAQKIEVKTYGIAEGLSQSMVTSVCEDRDGFIWLGTLNGLNRFDGKNFKVFLNRPDDSFSPIGNLVTSIFEDSKGRLWIGYNEGIDCYDKISGRFYHLGSSFNTLNLKDQNTAPLFETSDGHIWLRGNSSIVEMIVPDDFPANPTQVEKIKYIPSAFKHGFPDGGWNIRLYQASEGKVCVEFSNKSCYVLNRQNQQWVSVNPQILDNDIENSYCEVVYDASRSGYWSVLQQKLRFIKEKKVLYEIALPPNVIGFNEVHLDKKNFKIDKEGIIWLWSKDEQYPQLYRINPQVSENKVEEVLNVTNKKLRSRGIIIDKQQTVWVSTNGTGVFQIVSKKTPFKSYLKGNSLSNIESRGKNSEHFSVRTDNGIIEVSNFNTLKRNKIQYKGNSYDLAQIKYASDGTLCATIKVEEKPMLYRKNLAGREDFMDIPPFRSSDVMFEDNQNRIWLSSSMDDFSYLTPGANEVKRVAIKQVWKDHKETDIYIKQMYQSIDNIIWIATSQGLVEMSAPIGEEPVFKLWKKIDKKPNSLTTNNLLAVLDDPVEPKHYLWLATNGNGISKMNKQTGDCVHFNKNDGLANDVVYGIFADKSGRLWLSTNFGVSCFNPANKHFKNFTIEDGLQGNEFNTQAYYQFFDGQICFGGLDGCTIFNPNEFNATSTFAPVFFTDLKINNKLITLRDSTKILNEPLEFIKKISLAYNQNFVSISFAALDFVNNEKTTYFYKLEGIDADWAFADKKTEVNYANLSPGYYVLYVANVNENGEKNPKPTQLTIIVRPPWWRTWLAYGLYVLIAGIIAYIIFKNQVNKARIQTELLFKEKEASTLQEIAHLKSHFFTNITHEFRTPLTLIIEPTRQLLQNQALLKYESQHRIILNNANRLLLLVNQLLDLSKIEGGKIQMNWVEGDLLVVIREVFDLFELITAKNQQKLTWNTPLSELKGIIDRQMLEKIIYNLLSNAQKFTAIGGEIELSIHKPNNSHWQLSIRDTGIGIAEEHLPFIFNRFYQADNSLTRRSEGTGVGLSLVKELVDLLKSNIIVESQLGKGTIFSIEFPLYPVSHTAAKTDVIAQEYLPYSNLLNTQVDWQKNINLENSNNLTILIVEDNAELRQFLHMNFTQLGYSILEAENGKIGLEIAREMLPDLIITDVMMPEMDGFQLTERIKNDMLTSHIPIVILTAKGRLESKIAGYKYGADAYLPKPFNMEELMVRVQQLLTTRTLLQQKYAQATNFIGIKNTQQIAANDESQKIADMSLLDIEFMDKIYAYIQENLDNEEISIENLTKKFAMSRSQIFRKISVLTGLPPAKLIRNYRLDAAMQMFSEKQNTRVIDVMHAVGFSDAKYFSKVFKEHFGMSPQSVILKNKDNMGA